MEVPCLFVPRPFTSQTRLGSTSVSRERVADPHADRERTIRSTEGAGWTRCGGRRQDPGPGKAGRDEWDWSVWVKRNPEEYPSGHLPLLSQSPTHPVPRGLVPGGRRRTEGRECRPRPGGGRRTRTRSTKGEGVLSGSGPPTQTGGDASLPSSPRPPTPPCRWGRLPILWAYERWTKDGPVGLEPRRLGSEVLERGRPAAPQVWVHAPRCGGSRRRGVDTRRTTGAHEPDVKRGAPHGTSDEW